jgi:hypothetical protein
MHWRSKLEGGIDVLEVQVLLTDLPAHFGGFYWSKKLLEQKK